MNPNAPGSLREWPVSGSWLVALVRTQDRELACVVMTGKRSDSSGEFYFWGFRRLGQKWGVVVVDKNASAVAGDTLQITIDGSEIGSFPVARRAEQSGMSSVRADIPSYEADELSRLLPIGGKITISTSSATYSSTLTGMRDAFSNINDCVNEMSELSRKPRN